MVKRKAGFLKAFEFKWGKNKEVHFPSTFIDNYTGSTTSLITPDNAEKFIMNS